MSQIGTYISDNKEWLFSGIGVLVISSILYLLKDKIFGTKTESVNTNSNANTINNNIVINSRDSREERKIKEEQEERRKDLTRILFVDDDTKFKTVSILKRAGWKNTISKKDIIDLDDNDAINSDIIFVDINGVGSELFNDQGLGLASALKKKYPEKKIVLYSAETTGDRFHSALREVDSCLSKNAEPYEFINLVENFASEIY